MNLGKLYYLHGYEQHKNILLDVIDYVSPDVSAMIKTNAHPRVEVILQKFAMNTPENYNKPADDGLILHLVNLTGFSGNTYFNPLPTYHLNFKIRSDYKPNRIFSLVNEKEISFHWTDGHISFTLDSLNEYEGIVMTK